MHAKNNENCAILIWFDLCNERLRLINRPNYANDDEIFVLIYNSANCSSIIEKVLCLCRIVRNTLFFLLFYDAKQFQFFSKLNWISLLAQQNSIANIFHLSIVEVL